MKFEYVKYRNVIFDKNKGLSKEYIKNVFDISKVYSTDRKKIRVPGEDVQKLAEGVLTETTNEFIKKWTSGRKYVRTAISKESFESSGYNFDPNITKILINEDIRINCLDDLYDDEMNKQERGKYILELLRCNCSHNEKLYQYPEDLSKKISKEIENYYKDILLVLFGENIHKNNLFKNMYNRSHDMTIYYRLPLCNFQIENNDKKNIVESSKYLRIANLFKKDLYDIEHDINNGTDSFVIEALCKNNIQEIFKEFLDNTNEKLTKIKDNLNNEISLKLCEKIIQQTDNEFKIAEYKIKNILNDEKILNKII